MTSRESAIELCMLRGLDPHEMVGHSPPPNPDGSVNAVLVMSARWRLAEIELLDFALKLKALGVYVPSQNAN